MLGVSVLVTEKLFPMVAVRHPGSIAGKPRGKDSGGGSLSPWGGQG